MPDPLPPAPFTAFNFSVEITTGRGRPLCSGAFAECDGLELNQEVKTIREGGNNGVQVRMAGPTAYGTLTLKRGMTESYDLWNWFERSIADPSLTAHAEVVVKGQNRTTKLASFALQRCRPLKLKAPPLNAKDGIVAIEELQVAYESLRLRPPPPPPPPPGGTTRA
jgi:phage tail-like protein